MKQKNKNKRSRKNSLKQSPSTTLSLGGNVKSSIATIITHNANSTVDAHRGMVRMLFFVPFCPAIMTTATDFSDLSLLVVAQLRLNDASGNAKKWESESIHQY